MTDPGGTPVDLLGDDDEFERLGRRAGAELRLSPPAEGSRSIERAASRRRAATVAAVAATTVTCVVAGLFVVSTRQESSPAPAVSVPPAVTTVADTVAPAPPGSTDSVADSIATTVALDPVTSAAPDVPAGSAPGTWRSVRESPLAPDGVASAAWTGREAIIVGHSADAESVPYAVAYDVGADRWRRLVDPPPALLTDSSSGPPPELQWTGTEVLAVTGDGSVYSYDPDADRWDEGVRPPAAFAPGEALIARSPRGVLVGSSSSWWWYSGAEGRWQSVPAPTAEADESLLEALDDDTIVASRIDGATITSAVFDTASLSWRDGPPVDEYPISQRSGDASVCDGIDGRLVCYAEGYGTLTGVVIDPLRGSAEPFSLGNHSSSMSVSGLPWLFHAWKLLSPRTASWEDLPPSPRAEVDGFIAAVWTGSEIVFFGGNDGGEPLGLVAAYSPVEVLD